MLAERANAHVAGSHLARKRHVCAALRGHDDDLARHLRGLPTGFEATMQRIEIDRLGAFGSTNFITCSQFARTVLPTKLLWRLIAIHFVNVAGFLVIAWCSLLHR